MDTHSYEVTQRSAGVNLSVDIAATTADALGTGVAAYIQGDTVSAQGLYSVPPHNAVINETISAANASNPRIDRVILEIQDNTHDASGANLIRTRVVTGTATAGATLDNLSNAAAVPSSALLLADVLVPANATSINNSNIRDRRKWARGAYCVVNLSTQKTTTATTMALIDSTNLYPRVERSGAPLRVTLAAGIFLQVSDIDLFIDGASASQDRAWADGGNNPNVLQWYVTPSAGSHKIGPAWKAISGQTATMNSATVTQLVVEEVPRQSTVNNPTTTG
jgi:hypothetical protein